MPARFTPYFTECTSFSLEIKSLRGVSVSPYLSCSLYLGSLEAWFICYPHLIRCCFRCWCYIHHLCLLQFDGSPFASFFYKFVCKMPQHLRTHQEMLLVWSDLAICFVASQGMPNWSPSTPEKPNTQSKLWGTRSKSRPLSLLALPSFIFLSFWRSALSPLSRIIAQQQRVLWKKLGSDT